MIHAAYDTKPEFICSNPYFQNFYDYRWQNLKRLTFDFSWSWEDSTYLRYPGVFEGPSHFRRHISYSAFAHMLELRWLKDPELAQGSLLNFIENQRDDGSFPGHIGPPNDPSSFTEPHSQSFYHANWGRALMELHLLHPSPEFWGKIYPGLLGYLDYFERERNDGLSALFTVHNQFETGQEFSPRYTAIAQDADLARWGKRFELFGVDATVYMYELYRALSGIALALGHNEQAKRFKRLAQLTKKSVLEFMWNPEELLFFDVDPTTYKQTGVKALTCFYPYFTDIVARKHLPGLAKHLFAPCEFWTEFPFPTLSQDDPMFSAEGMWKGKKELCPWNGRVWPMTNSHMAEAIALCAIRFNSKRLRERFVEFFNCWIEMMCLDRDPSRPASFEHYNPLTGTPSAKEYGFSGINDYLHSWINDLIIKYVVGFRPQGNGKFVVDPFPFGADFTLRNIHYGDFDIEIRAQKGLVSILGNKTLLGTSLVGIPFTWPLM